MLTSVQDSHVWFSDLRGHVFFKEEVLAFVGGGLDQAFYRSSELEFVSSRLR